MKNANANANGSRARARARSAPPSRRSHTVQAVADDMREVRGRAAASVRRAAAAGEAVGTEQAALAKSLRGAVRRGKAIVRETAEAAAELRKGRDEALETYYGSLPGGSAAAQLAAASAANERLLLERNDLKVRLARAEAEAESLRAFQEREKRVGAEVGRRVRELVAENERLRAGSALSRRGVRSSAQEAAALAEERDRAVEASRRGEALVDEASGVVREALAERDRALERAAAGEEACRAAAEKSAQQAREAKRLQGRVHELTAEMKGRQGHRAAEREYSEARQAAAAELDRARAWGEAQAMEGERLRLRVRELAEENERLRRPGGPTLQRRVRELTAEVREANSLALEQHALAQQEVKATREAAAIRETRLRAEIARLAKHHEPRQPPGETSEPASGARQQLRRAGPKHFVRRRSLLALARAGKGVAETHSRLRDMVARQADEASRLLRSFASACLRAATPPAPLQTGRPRCPARTHAFPRELTGVRALARVATTGDRERHLAGQRQADRQRHRKLLRRVGAAARSPAEELELVVSAAEGGVAVRGRRAYPFESVRVPADAFAGLDPWLPRAAVVSCGCASATGSFGTALAAEAAAWIVRARGPGPVRVSAVLVERDGPGRVVALPETVDASAAAVARTVESARRRRRQSVGHAEGAWHFIVRYERPGALLMVAELAPWVSRRAACEEGAAAATSGRDMAALAQSLGALDRLTAGVVPWRDSALTRELRDVMSAPARVNLVASVRPEAYYEADAVSSLEFCAHALAPRAAAATHAPEAPDVVREELEGVRVPFL